MIKSYDILVVDDEQLIIDSITKIVASENLSIDESLDGSEALEKLGINKYRLIISDIMMPVLDGFQLLDEIEKRNIKTPVIITTGYSTIENAAKALTKGAVGFISKPFTFDELMSMIQRGLKFGKLLGAIEKEYTQPDPSSVVYVSCPPKYRRLGYFSWINFENDGSVIIGATDLYLKSLGSITRIELVELNENLTQCTVCATFETDDKLTHHFLSTISGKVIKRNEKLLKDITLIEKDPYFEGWIYRLIPSDVEFEIKNLIPCSSDRL